MSGRKKLSLLRAKVKGSLEKTQQVKVEVAEKRQQRPSRKKQLPSPTNSKTVERWFREEIQALYGRRFLVAAWAVKERTLAKKVLAEYGEDLAEKGVRHFCKIWPDMVKKSRGRLRGQPTMGFLYAARHSIFSEVQLIELNGTAETEDPVDSDEYRESDDPALGW